MSTLTGNQISSFRLKVLSSALRLECLGMKRGGKSAYSIVKQEFGFKGNKIEVLDQLEKLIKGRENETT